MTNSEAIQMKTCPNCGASMPFYRDFVTWCQQCDWGLNGDNHDEKKKNPFETMYDSLGKKQSREIFTKLQQAKNLQPAWSKTRVLIYMMAGMVHLVSLALFAAGLLMLVTLWQYIFFAVLGLVLLTLAWILRPRPIPEPTENVLTRAEFPAFYQLVDQIAQSLGTRVDQIVIDAWFNASFSQTGWKQKHTLTIGLPLWEILSDQERVALIAHEMAHSVNGDVSRSFLVGSAIQSLMKWHQVLVPRPDVAPDTGLVSLLGIPFKILAAGAAGMVWYLMRLLIILLFRDMQRAEYLADRMGASISGNEAFIGSLRKMYFSDTFLLAVQHCALNSQKPNLYQELHELIDCTPPSELERLRRLETRTMSTLEVTHPPTGLRIQMIQEQGPQTSGLTPDPERMRDIDQALTKYRAKIQIHLLDQYRAAISY